MIECPKCSKLNNIYNTKCYKCGADLPSNPETSYTQEPLLFAGDSTMISKSSNNSKKISNIALAICIIGIILSIVLSAFFQVATVKTVYYHTETTYSFNWGLCVGMIIGTVCFTVLLKAMSYIARAIEEK